MKNVCILYHGQLRTFNYVVDSHKFNLLDDNNDIKYHILYTTWLDEDDSDFKIHYPTSYIRKVKTPIREDMKWDDRFRPHSSNPQHKGDNFHYFCQLTIWKESSNTILEYEKLNDIKFDIVIRLRPDTVFQQNIDNKSNFYNVEDNFVYVPMEMRFDVYGTGSVPDQIIWGKRDHIFKILNGLDIVDKVQQEPFVFHPETSLHNMIKYYNLNIKYYNLNTFVLYKEDIPFFILHHTV